MQLGKNNYQFKLIKKLDGNKPHRVTLQDIVQKLDALDKKIDFVYEKLSTRLNAIVTANHLIDPTK